MKNSLFALLTAVISITSFGQILSVSPAFPTINDVVTIVYDATEGNGALTGVSPVYAHTGVITGTNLSAWQYVQGNWGTADAAVLMTSLGNNLFQFTIDIDQFYGFPVGTNINYLSFVFRNASGTIVGRSASGADIFYPVYPVNSGLLAKIFNPETTTALDVNMQLPIMGKANQASTLTLKDNGVILASQTNAIQLNHTLTATTLGSHLLEFVATNGTATVIDSAYYIVNPPINYQNPPVGMKNGLNVLSDSSVLIQLYAPEKNHVYLIGDFTNWQPQTNYHMNCSTDSTTWWKLVSGLTANQFYGYQFLIDNNLKLADPLSTLIADPNNDNAIDTNTYPNRYVYPTNLTNGFISLFKVGETPFNWQNDNFQRPPKKELMIYELLVRDFIAKHNYQTLIDTLDYLDSLGINAIELMPISEFENNESWGYNPSFHMALDKYYGTPEKFKSFVDACHSRGIAVIMDIALNHAFGQNPMVNMYWDAANNRTAPNNPWFNVTCPHTPYCWGYDLNHEAQATKNYIDRVNLHWLDEFHIDGFRFDYTKGFVNSAAGFSQTRINILKRMADTIWAIHPNTYVILEHWADNSEEIQLSNYGMMLWGNVAYDYRNAVKGNASNVSSGIYTNRSWTQPNLITFLESHDEERVMYDAITNGSSVNPAHNVKSSYIALARSEAAAVLMLTTPGPKMIWQFAELGYDVSIDYGCRICNKPIRWNYLDQSNRKRLFDVYKATMYLRQNYPTFQSLTFTYALAGTMKRIVFTDPAMDAVVMANFSVQVTSTNGSFTSTGWWYEYFTGDSINVTSTTMSMTFQPGEYRIYTQQRIAKPTILPILGLTDFAYDFTDVAVVPNPFNNELEIAFEAQNNEPCALQIIDLTGKVVYISQLNSDGSGNYYDVLSLGHLEVGTYFLRLRNGESVQQQKIIKM